MSHIKSHFNSRGRKCVCVYTMLYAASTTGREGPFINSSGNLAPFHLFPAWCVLEPLFDVKHFWAMWLLAVIDSLTRLCSVQFHLERARRAGERPRRSAAAAAYGLIYSHFACMSYTEIIRNGTRGPGPNSPPSPYYNNSSGEHHESQGRERKEGETLYRNTYWNITTT